MNRPYRWGILGAGRIAEKFASAIDYTEGSEVYAVASRDAHKAKTFAEKHGASRVYDEYLKLAKDPEVDVIYIATPHAFHKEQAILCLNHKKPVISEKPMALNYQQVKEIVDAAKINNSFLMEGMWSRFMPSINRVLELVNEDVIGPVTFIRADFGFQAPYEPHGRLFDLKLGGGSLLDVGIYPLFLTTLLLGSPTKIQSMAILALMNIAVCNFNMQEGRLLIFFLPSVLKLRLPQRLSVQRGGYVCRHHFIKQQPSPWN
jgi:predicted dehydrogenase